MFTIDFLKNQGLPKKPRVFEVGLFTVIAAASLAVFCLLGIQYFHNNLVLQSKQKALIRCESRLQKASGEGSLEFRIEKNLSIYDECYFEIANSIGRYVQWTPVLREFAGSLPSSMLLNELSVIRTIEKKKVTSIIDPKKKVDIEIIHRTLKSDVYDFMPGAEGTAVKNYLDSLRSSQLLIDVLDKAYIVESSDAEYEDSDGKKHKVRNYIVDCLLKSQEIADVQ